mgnify:CR=1 FL=1
MYMVSLLNIYLACELFWFSITERINTTIKIQKTKGEKQMKKTLIVIDMQNDFVTGALKNPAAEAIIPNIKKKIEFPRNNRNSL